jgi:hypothetical protein
MPLVQAVDITDAQPGTGWFGHGRGMIAGMAERWGEDGQGEGITCSQMRWVSLLSNHSAC